jgi:hypothetical protein
VTQQINEDYPTVTQFALSKTTIMPVQLDQFWIPGTASHPPATERLLAAVESRYDIKLPKLLRALYRLQNGGKTEFDDFFEFWPIARKTETRIQTIRDLFIMMEFDDPEEMTDELLQASIDRMLVIGCDLSGHVWLALDYSNLNSDGLPQLLRFDNECLTFNALNMTFAEYIDDLTTVQDEPSVRCPVGEPIAVEPIGSGEQKLFMTENEILLYVRRDDEITLTHISTQLNIAACKIDPVVQGRDDTFQLYIQPWREWESDDVVIWHETARKTTHGWRCSTTEGVPIYVTFLSRDRHQLEALREHLCGMNSEEWTEFVASFDLQEVPHAQVPYGTPLCVVKATIGGDKEQMRYEQSLYNEDWTQSLYLVATAADGTETRTIHSLRNGIDKDSGSIQQTSESHPGFKLVLEPAESSNMGGWVSTKVDKGWRNQNLKDGDGQTVIYSNNRKELELFFRKLIEFDPQ